jgi:catechol 2,3-dioxygenase-like lactoylglutathione lyase family enzyme
MKIKHIALVVPDIEAAAQFYEAVFDMKRVGRDDLAMGSGIYLSDGETNLALLCYREGHPMCPPSGYAGVHHFGFQVKDLEQTEERIKAAGGTFYFAFPGDPEKMNFEKKFKGPFGTIFDISKSGWEGAPAKLD